MHARFFGTEVPQDDLSSGSGDHGGGSHEISTRNEHDHQHDALDRECIPQFYGAGEQPELLQFLEFLGSELGDFGGGIFFLHLLVDSFRFGWLLAGLVGFSQLHLSSGFANAPRGLRN